ncbi:MAG TPA: DUF4382 domain-containing protein, partial [Hanamia sp.]|nr:DUF4382 domain-containing protein [Hanamia sp.]
DSANIDIRYVEVKIDTSARHIDDDKYGDNDVDEDDDHLHSDQYGKWDTLTINPGVYNISSLRNGVDTLLGTANIAQGTIRKIRLTLGTNNSVVVAGVRNSLSLYPGTNNYVYVKIHDGDEDEEEDYNYNTFIKTSVWIDFNICESIKLKNGQYYLKPVLKTFGKKNFGEIEGKVFPYSAHPSVIVSNAVDSASAIPEDDGEYKIEGLKQGAFQVTFKGTAGFKDTTIANVQVQNGKETHLPNITLHQ